MLEDFFEDIDLTNFVESISDLLEYEININEKIINNVPLTEKEYFFKKYIVSPSFVINKMIKDKKNKEN